METLKKYELIPINGRKSFYGKCTVIDIKNGANHIKSELYSYDTKVVVYNHTNNELTFLAKKEHLSNTTLIHINTFLDYFGFDKMSKKQILES
jgi:hypothetical protein